MKRTLLIPLILVLAACDSDPAAAPEADSVLIANGGNFSDQNGSVSRLALSDGLVSGGPVLDGFVQAAVPTPSGSLVLVNTFSGGRIDLLDTAGSRTGSVADIPSPRGVVVDGTQAFATMFGFDGSGAVLTVDLTTGAATGDPIPVGAYPEGIAQTGDRLLVANYGFIGSGRSLSVVNRASGEVTTVEVACDGPRDVHAVAGGEVAVVCQGKTVYNDDFSEVLEQTTGRVLFLDAETLALQAAVAFDGQVGSSGGGEASATSPEHLMVLDGAANRIRRVSLSTRQEISSWELSADGSYVGLSGIEHVGDRWYVGRMARAAGGAFPDFTAAGAVAVLDESGNEVGLHVVGPAPTHIAQD